LHCACSAFIALSRTPKKRALLVDSFFVLELQSERTIALPVAVVPALNSQLSWGIVLEEADETVFWLELLQDASIVPKEKLSALAKEANELVAIFVASLRTVKGADSAA
jgi:hypothetical protein